MEQHEQHRRLERHAHMMHCGRPTAKNGLHTQLEQHVLRMQLEQHGGRMQLEQRGMQLERLRHDGQLERIGTPASKTNEYEWLKCEIYNRSNAVYRNCAYTLYVLEYEVAAGTTALTTGP